MVLAHFKLTICSLKKFAFEKTVLSECYSQNCFLTFFVSTKRQVVFS